MINKNQIIPLTLTIILGLLFFSSPVWMFYLLSYLGEKLMLENLFLILFFIFSFIWSIFIVRMIIFDFGNHCFEDKKTIWKK